MAKLLNSRKHGMRKRIPLLFLTLLTFVSGATQASGNNNARSSDKSNDLKIEAACPSKKKVYENILFCAENVNASKQARTCANVLIGVAQANSLILRKSMKTLEESLKSSQNKTFVTNAKQLYAAILNLKSNIALFQTKTSLVASYSESMLDVPGSKNAEDSLDCFNVAFDDLQKTVSRLDQEIINMKNAYRSAAGLLKTAAVHSKNLGSLGEPIPQAEDLDASNVTNTPSKRPTGKSIRSSDISGTEEKKKP